MKLLIVFAVLCAWSAYAQSNTGPLNSGPGIGGPSSSMWMRRRPYPSVFEQLLPLEMKQKIAEISNDQELSHEERRKQIDDILDTVPGEELAKLPLPKEFEKLPTGVYDQIKLIHEDPNLKWTERNQKIRELLHTLTPDQRRTVFKNTWFPQMPPPGFEDVISPSLYQQLVAVHQNPILSVAEKKQKVDSIMQKVPADQLAKLPLPPLMTRLPLETQQRIRTIMHNYNTPWDERHKLVREFVKSLPVEEKRMMRPELPPFVKDLPADVQARIQEIHDNDNLELRERFRRFREIIDSLPDNVRAQIRPQGPPPRMPWQH